MSGPGAGHDRGRAGGREEEPGRGPSGPPDGNGGGRLTPVGGYLAALVDSMGEAVVAVDRDLRVTYLNPAAVTMTGRTADRAGSLVVDQLLCLEPDEPLCLEPDETRPGLVDRCREVVATGRPVSVDHADALVGLGGLVVPVDYRITPLRADGGEVAGVVIVLRDVTEARRERAVLHERALRDPLTGLWNRELLRSRSGHCPLPAGRALLCIDLDGFKEVNDTCGHQAGDAVLVQVAELLTSLVGAEDDVVRMGGDEFLVVLPDCDAGRASATADHLVKALTDHEFRWVAARFRLGASIGVATDGTGERDLDALTAEADYACYRAKRLGGGMVAVASR